MKTWKHADFIIQCILIFTSLGFAIARGFEGSEMFWAYLLVGGWQLVSCLINAVWTKGQWKVSDRKTYLITVLILILSAVPVYFDMINAGDFIFKYLFGLLFITPLLALWYISICYREWQLIRTKDFMHLK